MCGVWPSTAQCVCVLVSQLGASSTMVLFLCHLPSPFPLALPTYLLQIKYSGGGVGSPGVTPLAYCEQVSVAEYESQRLSASQMALYQLLENVVHDCRMTQKDKRRRLKQVGVTLTPATVWCNMYIVCW